MEQKPVLFLTNFHPFISRNIFDSGAVSRIAEGAEHVYVFVLKHKEEYLREKYEKDNITVIGVDLDAYITAPKEVQLRRIAELLLDTRTKRLHQMIYRSRGGSLLKYIAARITMYVGGHSTLIKRLFRSYVQRHYTTTPFDAYFTAHTPTRAVATDPFSPFDLLFLKAAVHAHVPTTAIIRSWDNFGTKEYLSVLPDSVIVQNEEMIREAMVLHDIPKDRIRIVGVPQFEYYTKYNPIPRDEFCHKLGLDSQKEIIMFSPAGDKFSNTDWQVCEILRMAIEEGKFIKPVQLLVRLHPMNPTNLEKCIPSPHVVIDDPRVALKGKTVKEAEMGFAEVNHLADTLAHSAVVLNVVSSLLIDAAVMKKPIVTVGFDGWEKNVPLVRSVLAEQSNEWMKVLLDKGLSPVAHDPEELIERINEYLENPEKDGSLREHFVAEHCWKLDGKAPERIAHFLLNPDAQNAY